MKRNYANQAMPYGGGYRNWARNTGDRPHHAQSHIKRVRYNTTMAIPMDDEMALGRLNEFLMARKMKSNFDLIDSRGPAHCPLFTIRLAIYDRNGILCSETTGTGKTKKFARQIAAKLFFRNFSEKENDSHNNNHNHNNNDKHFNKTHNYNAHTNKDENQANRDKSNIKTANETVATVNEMGKEQQQSEQDDENGNSVSILDALCRHDGLEKPLYEYRMMKSIPPTIFECVCKLKNITCHGSGATKKSAKQSAAHFMYERMKEIEAQTTQAMSNVSENDDAYDSDEVTFVGSVEADVVDTKLIGTTESDIERNGFAIMKDVDTAETISKLEKTVHLWTAKCAKDLKCSPRDYLAAINHWQHPSELTGMYSLWIVSTLRGKIRDLLGADVMHMGTSVIRANRLNVTELNSNILTTFYEFCVWLPIVIADAGKDADYFVLNATDESGNNTVRKYVPKIGEALICHHKTHFRFCGTDDMRTKHFFLVTEWKRSTHNEMDSLHRIISTTSMKPSQLHIFQTLVDGMTAIRGAEVTYANLIECIREWQLILDYYTNGTAFEYNVFFEKYIQDMDRLKKTLTKFLFELTAHQLHNARECEDAVYKEFEVQLMTPIKYYLSSMHAE